MFLGNIGRVNAAICGRPFWRGGLSGYREGVAFVVGGYWLAGGCGLSRCPVRGCGRALGVADGLAPRREKARVGSLVWYHDGFRVGLGPFREGVLGRFFVWFRLGFGRGIWE